MISILLVRKIVQLFFILILGFLVVRLGLLESKDSFVLSKLCLYLIMPFSVFQAFQVEYQPAIFHGLMLAFGVALFIHILLILLGMLCKRLFHMDVVERASVIYSNCGNLIIPVVSSIMGPEWVIYTSGYLTAQAIFAWTHCISIFSGEKKLNWKKIIGNMNILAIIFGGILFFLNLRLPVILGEAVESVSSMIGPVSMLITGMLFASADLKQVLRQKRTYLVVFLRMIVSPAVVLVLLAATGVRDWIPGGREVLLVTYLAAMAPTGSFITQFAQIHHKNAEYASAINILTTLTCIVTMPVFVALYEMF